jgi:ferrochelatase
MVFSAHGTPETLMRQGDPYSQQISRTVEHVMNSRHSFNEYHLCFQSKVGPFKWLGPATHTWIKELARRGKKHLLIIPISFVSDQIETLFELDIEYRKIAERSGIENYVVMRGFNDSEIFIDALKDIVVNALQIHLSRFAQQ